MDFVLSKYQPGLLKLSSTLDVKISAPLRNTFCVRPTVKEVSNITDDYHILGCQSYL
jgi:hypothetical protein